VVVLASRQTNASDASARLIQRFICLKSLTAWDDGVIGDDEFVQGKKKALGIR
jgi:hypothetical protein